MSSVGVVPGNLQNAVNEKLHYRTTSTTTWSEVAMNQTSDGTTWYFDLASLPVTFPSIVYYYISAGSQAWDGTNAYTAYRPYRYSFDEKPPTDLPFVAYVDPAASTLSVQNTSTGQGSILQSANVIVDGAITITSLNGQGATEYMKYSVVFNKQVEPTIWNVTNTVINQSFTLKLWGDELPIIEGKSKWEGRPPFRT